MPTSPTPDYKIIRKQFDDLKEASTNIISRMSTLAALLHHSMPKNSWTGFYMLEDDKLIVGPFQGPIACLNLKKNTGVCWSSVNQQESIVVANVHEFSGHIACDSKTCSEIVVPCFNEKGRIFAVLDIDSYEYDTFNQNDANELEKIVALL